MHHLSERTTERPIYVKVSLYYATRLITSPFFIGKQLFFDDTTLVIVGQHLSVSSFMENDKRFLRVFTFLNKLLFCIHKQGQITFLSNDANVQLSHFVISKLAIVFYLSQISDVI